jgi:hypothetical protein
MIKSSRIRWVRHLESIGETRNEHEILVEKTERKRAARIPTRTQEKNLKRVSGNKVKESGLDSSGSGQVPVASSCEHGNEISDPIKGLKFLD